MPLTLLSSTRYNTDLPFTIPADVVSARSLVIEIVKITNVNRRMAGWMYSVVPTGLGDEEIADSKRLVFGKNRVEFTVHKNPYKLRFYPMYGLKTYDINVYSGFDRLDSGTQLNANFVGRLDLDTRGGVVQYRSTTGNTWTTIPGLAAISHAYYRPGNNVLIVRTHQGEVFYCVVGTWTWITDAVASLRVVVAENTTRSLFRQATQTL